VIPIIGGTPENKFTPGIVMKPIGRNMFSGAQSNMHGPLNEQPDIYSRICRYCIDGNGALSLQARKNISSIELLGVLLVVATECHNTATGSKVWDDIFLKHGIQIGDYKAILDDLSVLINLRN